MTQETFNLACGLQEEIAAIERKIGLADWHIKISKANEGANASEILVCNMTNSAQRIIVPNDVCPVNEFLNEYRRRVVRQLERLQTEFDSL